MGNIEEKLKELKSEFSEFEDGFERYSYLVELAGFLPPYPSEKRTSDRLVRGCQSSVWLDITFENGLLFLLADSDTLIIKGMLVLLQEILNGASVAEVAKVNMDILSELGVKDNFSDKRQKGIQEVINTIRQAARNCVELDCVVDGS